MTKKYAIESDSLTGLIARVVFILRKESPSIGTMNLDCHDGTKVKITTKSKHPPRAAIKANETGEYANGVLINGQLVRLE